MPKHLDLKDILHHIIDSLDLNPGHRADLHEAVDIHDDPTAQAAKDAEQNDARDAEVRELEARLAELRPAKTPAPGSVTGTSATPASPDPAPESAPSVPIGSANAPAVPRSNTAPAASFTPAQDA